MPAFPFGLLTNSTIPSSFWLCLFMVWPFSSVKNFVVVQSLSCVWLFLMPWTAESQAPLSFTISQGLLKLMSIESVMPSNHLILCCPLLLLPSMFPSIRVFSIESALRIRWPEYWGFSTSPSNEYSEFISFRIDWFDLLAVQGSQESSPAPQLWNIMTAKKFLEMNPDLLTPTLRD